MCAAQLAKIVCYQPGTLFEWQLPSWLATENFRTLTFEGPYLILIPTMLLSAGMLMFFTLGSSMVGDVCDEDELNTGTRSEGTYYSVFWWFIKMGTAGASFVMGALLVYTSFDERQNMLMDAVAGNVAIIKAESEAWATEQVASANQVAKLTAEVDKLTENARKLRDHFAERITSHPDHESHLTSLLNHADAMSNSAADLKRVTAESKRDQLLASASSLLEQSVFLRQQSPVTLLRLRIVEIGLPLVLSVVSIILTLRYPLTEARCYEIKELLTARRGTAAS
jgi:Na+/melibiose symporter-like transporter